MTLSPGNARGQRVSWTTQCEPEPEGPPGFGCLFLCEGTTEYSLLVPL